MTHGQTLSIFVDESGNLSCTNDSSRFYLLCLLLHDQSNSVIAAKIEAGMSLTKSEEKFFGGLRRFKRNVLKPLMSKSI